MGPEAVYARPSLLFFKAEPNAEAVQTRFEDLCKVFLEGGRVGGIQHRVNARPHPGDQLYEAKRSVHHAFVARRFDELGQAVWHPEDHHCQLYRDQDFSRMILLQNQRGARLLFILLALLSEPKVRQEGLPMESAQRAL